MAAFDYRNAEAVRDALRRHGVRYLFFGKSGATLLGYSDTTQDVDIVVDNEQTNCEKLLAALQDQDAIWLAHGWGDQALMVRQDRVVLSRALPTTLRQRSHLTRRVRAQEPQRHRLDILARDVSTEPAPQLHRRPPPLLPPGKQRTKRAGEVANASPPSAKPAGVRVLTAGPTLISSPAISPSAARISRLLVLSPQYGRATVP